MKEWLRDRSLTLALMAIFVVCVLGQVLAGHREFNSSLAEHGAAAVTLSAYMRAGHFWEALFENWESEFLQMAAYVLLTTVLYQAGSPESKRPGRHELVDADPRAYADMPDVPWPVRRGGWVLWFYERSLGIAFLVLFLVSFVGHALGGWREACADERLHGAEPPGLVEFLGSSQFWFQSFQNWQSEFLSIAAMVWFTVYLRQRGSPESKPVHAPYDETGH